MTLEYHLSFKGTSSLIIQIQEKNSRRILYLDALQKLGKEEDQEALSLLVKMHLRAARAPRDLETLSFQEVEIAADYSLNVLRLLSRTKRLFHKRAPLLFEEGIVLFWRGEKHSEKACTFSPFLRCKDCEVPLAECERVFPQWGLWEGRALSFETKIPWKWIELFVQGPQLLEGAAKKKFLEEEPPIFWKEPAAQSPLEVFPELVLTDATGCFANLWMHYPEVGKIAFSDLSPSIAGKTRLRKEEEGWERDLLETGFLKKTVGNSHYYCPGDKTREALLFLLDLGWKVFDAQKRSVLRQTGANWNVREEGGAIAVSGQLHFGEKRLSFRTMAHARSLWVALDASSVGLFNENQLRELEGEWEGEEMRLKKSAASALSPLLESSQSQWETSARRLVEGLKEGASLERAPPASAFRGELLPYQQQGVDWLAFLHKWGFSGLLADEMGLGKTVQVLAFFSRLRTKLPLLIVAPSSLLYQWRSEMEKFLPAAKVYLHTGGDRKKEISAFQGVDWIITSYSLLRLDEALFSQLSFEAIVLDESGAIKTATTQTARSAFCLKGRFKVALTGTPIENRPEELWSQFRFLMPELFGDKASFRAADAELLRRKVRPFLLRRRKRDVELDLPEKIEQLTWVEMLPEQRALYDSYLAAVKSGVLKKIEADGIQSHRMEMLEAILRLRQICCDPRLIGEKIEGSRIEKLLEDAEDKKALIYSQFTSMLQLIAKELEKRGEPYLYLDGATPLKERADLVQRFQGEKEPNLFLISLKAGSAGLNLTAAEYVFLFDPWWNKAVEAQAIDRAHRIGQKKAIIAKRYLAPHSIEEKMLQLKEKKQAQAEELLKAEPLNWTKEDWLHLLS